MKVWLGKLPVPPAWIFALGFVCCFMNKAQLSSPTTLTAANHADGASYADGTNYADGAANTSDDDDWASFSKTAYGQILEQDPNPQTHQQQQTGRPAQFPIYTSSIQRLLSWRVVVARGEVMSMGRRLLGSSIVVLWPLLWRASPAAPYAFLSSARRTLFPEPPASRSIGY
jgi:hypothetical protein